MLCNVLYHTPALGVSSRKEAAHMADKTEFAQRLRALRKRAGLTQEELHSIVDVSIMTLKRWEAGERSPRMEEIQRLASALHVTEAELLNGPEPNEIKITLHYSEMPKESEIQMNGNEFDLYMPGNGNLGIKGAAKFATLEDIDGFLARAREQLVEAFNFQQRRGTIPATA